MPVTQPNLHNFFKVKKQTKNTLGKDSKIISGKKSGKTLSIKETDSTHTEVNIFPTKPVCPIQEIDEKSDSLANSSTIIEESEDNKAKEQENIDILKSEITDLIKENKTEETDLCKEEKTDETEETFTPKRKLEDNEAPSRKRKREQIKDIDDDESPFKASKSSQEEGELETRAVIAKRRLILEEKPVIKEQKKLDPKTIKEQLGKCGRLDELRSRLLKLNECEKKLHEFRSHSFRKDSMVAPSSPKKQVSLRESIKCSSPIKAKQLRVSPYKSPLKNRQTLASHQLKSFDSLDIEVSVSPSKSPLVSRTPVKSCSERFSHLAEPSSNRLQLPHRYQVIKEVFRAVDTIVSLLHNRQEVITYSKLKPAVQEMLRKTFSESQLGQLKTVFPLAYFFNQEKIKGAFNTASTSYQLTVKPNLDYKKEHSVSRNLMKELDETNKGDNKLQQYRKMGPSVLVERREIFHSALLDILKKHHNKFLENLEPPITLKGPIYRWHPEFPVDDIFPPPPSSLPQPPSSDAPKTAQDVLEKAKNTFSVNSRMKQAIESVASSSKASSSTTAALSSAAVDSKQVATALKGISLSLLEKIRAREATKATREMTRSSGASIELEMLSRLPELVRILRSMFITEKKAALPWESVMTKIIGSHSGSLSISEAENHVRMLMKELPGWCTSHKVRSGMYLKIDKNRQLNDLTDQLGAIIKERT